MADFDIGLMESQAVPLKGLTQMDLLRLTASEYQWWGSNLKGTLKEELNCPALGQELEGQLSP